MSGSLVAGVAAAAAALLLALFGGALEAASAWLPALAVSGAVLAVWTGGAGNRERTSGGRRRRLEQLTTVLLAGSLLAGTLLAAGTCDGPGFFGLPRSFWGLVLGVWLVPLLVTSLGFAAAFAPPDQESGLRRRRPHEPESVGEGKPERPA